MQALMAPEQARGQVQTLMVPPLQERGRAISVESLVFLFDQPVRTLFDYGASHSFISTSLVGILHLNTSLVKDPILVSNPVGGSTHPSMVCRDLRVSILGVGFECSAFILGFTGYSLILGVDWQPRRGAILDCERRVVRLLIHYGKTLIFLVTIGV